MNDRLNHSGIRFLVSPGLRITMVFLAWVVGTILVLFVSALLSAMLGNRQEAFLRISTVFQDLLMWIVPAVLTAMIVTRQPAKLLAIDSLPSGRQTLLAVLLLIVSSPLMSWIIKLNADVHLPDSMADIEQWLRAMEDNAEGLVQSMMGANTPGNLIVNILIIGIFAGFSEELFFRGTVQRVLATANMSPHVAIWTSAFIFSLLHFQFFGFVPRLLLGAMFGYLLLWSGSVWLPMLIHTINNSMFIILMAFTGSGEPDFGSQSQSWVAIAISAVLTALTLAALEKSKTVNQELKIKN